MRNLSGQLGEQTQNIRAGKMARTKVEVARKSAEEERPRRRRVSEKSSERASWVKVEGVCKKGEIRSERGVGIQSAKISGSRCENRKTGDGEVKAGPDEQRAVPDGGMQTVEHRQTPRPERGAKTRNVRAESGIAGKTGEELVRNPPNICRSRSTGSRGKGTGPGGGRRPGDKRRRARDNRKGRRKFRRDKSGKIESDPN